jgi:hypothetical protein
MRKETVYCDLCGLATHRPSVIKIGWINGAEHKYDVCNSCRVDLEDMETDGHKQEKLFLNILKIYGKKLFKHYEK